MADAARKLLGVELENATPEAKLAHARELILKYCGERWESKDGSVNHSVQQLRAHFDTLKMHGEGAKLGVSWQSLIDEMIRAREIRVTNGIVWVP